MQPDIFGLTDLSCSWIHGGPLAAKAAARVAQVAREVQVGPADLVAEAAMEAQVAMGATTVGATAVMTAAMAGAMPMIAVDPAVLAQVVVN